MLISNRGTLQRSLVVVSSKRLQESFTSTHVVPTAMRFSQANIQATETSKPKAQLHQLHSKPYNAFVLPVGYQGSWRGQKQRVGLVRRCRLSTQAVHNGSVLQQNPAQILAAIAVQLNAAASPAIFATN
jgi:hypothetical protein